MVEVSVSRCLGRPRVSEWDLPGPFRSDHHDCGATRSGGPRWRPRVEPSVTPVQECLVVVLVGAVGWDVVEASPLTRPPDRVDLSRVSGRVRTLSRFMSFWSWFLRVG